MRGWLATGVLVVASCATAEVSDDASSGGSDGQRSVDAGLVDAPCVPPPSPQMFEVSGQIETFVIPDCVESITIEAFGAKGGDGTLPAATGGRGARVRGTFEVVAGDMLSILVGEQGAPGVPFAVTNGQGGGCGGGGTFVIQGISPLIVAGGGGGATSNDNAAVNIALPGGDALVTEDGQPGNGTGAGAGGTAGNGGITGSNANGFHVGTAGGGLTGDGQGSSNGNTGAYGTANGPAQSFVNGGAGGAGGTQGRSGAFGGGGAAGFTGGGGGGYSGGGTASIFGTYGGGGGGSFSGGAAPEAEAGVGMGDGQVVISWDSPGQ